MIGLPHFLRTWQITRPVYRISVYRYTGIFHMILYRTALYGTLYGMATHGSYPKHIDFLLLKPYTDTFCWLPLPTWGANSFPLRWECHKRCKLIQVSITRGVNSLRTYHKRCDLTQVSTEIANTFSLPSDNVSDRERLPIWHFGLPSDNIDISLRDFDRRVPGACFTKTGRSEISPKYRSFLVCGW